MGRFIDVAIENIRRAVWMRSEHHHHHRECWCKSARLSFIFVYDNQFVSVVVSQWLVTRDWKWLARLTL